MSDIPSNAPRSGGESGEFGTILAPSQRRGRRAVTLRASGQGSESVAEMMNTADRSLADALRIIYRLLLLAMIVIVCAYFVSGFKRVTETETGVRTVLGKITERDIQPGFAASFPEPIGELIRVQKGEQTIELNKEFFFRLSESEEGMIREKGLQALAEGGNNAIDPDAEGALMTGDGGLVHARVRLTYQRTGASDNIQNIADDDGTQLNERKIVQAAARRGMVQAAARVSTDEFLRNQADPTRTGGDFRNVESLARDYAQKFLDTLKSGIEIKTFSVNQQTPPRFLMRTFNEVQSAKSTADKDVTDAEQARKQKLSETAGEAAELLLEQIDAYDRAITLGKVEEGDRLLGTIHAIMRRQAVTIEGREIIPEAFGAVSNMISEAEQYRTQVVSEAQSDAGMFAAKKAAYESNPSVMLNTEWSDALRRFLGRESVQTLVLPPGSERVVVQVNRDPAVTRDILARRMAAEAEKAAKERDAARKRAFSEGLLDGTGLGN